MNILIVSDFDGTINKKDLGAEFSRIIDTYPDLKEKLMTNTLSAPDLYRRLLCHDGVSFEAIRDFYVEQAVIDEHFIPFLRFIGEKDIPHIIVSDGFDLLIEATLGKNGVNDPICIFANTIRDKGNGIDIDFPFQGDDCIFSGVCKKRIMKAFKPYFDRIIYIGNGYSDIDAVPEADIVFARSTLKSYCNESSIPSLWYNDYGDIVKMLERSFKGIIFDLDGTLINSFSAIYESFNYAMRSLGLPEYSYEDVLKTIGMPLEDIMAHSDGITDPDYAVKLFRSHYEQIYLDKTTLLKGVEQVVEKLYREGFLMAVSTNKLGKYSRILLDHLGIGKYFKCVIGIGDGFRNKPHPDTIDKIITELGLKKEEVVYVGDSLVDSQTAGNAGIGFIGVSTGTMPFYDLSMTKPYVVLDAIEKLPAYLKPAG